MFNKRKNEEREKIVTMDEPAPVQSTTESEITDIEPPMVEQEDTYSSSSNGSVKPANGNLKPSIISEGFTFEGTITSDGVLNIAGTVRGKITAKSVLIDASGRVDGELNSDQLVIKGQLKGEVNCEDLNIGPLAHVDGSITYKYIHIQRGSKVSGKFIKN